jgi:hypothetical protein
VSDERLQGFRRDTEQTMRLIVLVLLVVSGGLGVLASQQAATIKEQQAQLAAASDALKAGSLTLQAKCAQQAKTVFVETGYKVSDMANYENHYNTRLNKCLVYLESHPMTGTLGWDNRTVVDAFENKEYATYLWHSVVDKKYWEVPPVKCNVQAASGAEQACKSVDEFTKLIKAYMEG